MRFDLSDDEWALLEPLMPKSSQERAHRRSQGHERDILRATHRDALARSAGTLWALHHGL